MRLIAESGSTKTDWCLFNLSNGKQIYKKSQGINPYFSNKDEIFRDIKQIFDDLEISQIQEVYFYGPGCSHDAQKEKLRTLFSEIFAQAYITIETDLVAAGRGLLGSVKGLACILGTGSNAGLFENGQLISSFPSLGYIFGDEGSGSYIGKQLISDVLNDALPPVVKELFDKTYNISHKVIIANVYAADFPNRYLASYTEFVYNNIQLTYCRTLVDNAFEDFFAKRLSKFDNLNTLNLKFTGSVAYAFAPLLVKVAQRYGAIINTETDICQSPLKGLVAYHNQE